MNMGLSINTFLCANPCKILQTIDDLRGNEFFTQTRTHMGAAYVKIISS
jgi:hypothetical protein